jgi:hypothetical protein
MAVVAALAALLAPHAAHAQEQAYWRATNPQPAVVAPAYEGEATPFPVKLKPVEHHEDVAAQQKPEETPEPVAQHRQALMAASLLSEIRKNIRTTSSMKEDTSAVQVNAITRGPGGDIALIRGRWLGVGEYVTVPIIAAQKVQDLITQLDSVDHNLAGIVRKEVADRISNLGPAKLRIIAIRDSAVVVKNSKGQKTVITFQPKDF